MKQVICKKSLYKSTYRKNAFNNGKTYYIHDQDKQFIWVTDENGNTMNFTEQERTPFYHFHKYFNL